ncbi:hypothetical protein RIR_jg17188.t2 [Rhizophagus irregularis DAOM 181602=DAOM 197198]|nr:hypothetical protein RIR_jg17188.t2 [Rhizophagus irregularis DAOM 181602=DAOM 197198]
MQMNWSLFRMAPNQTLASATTPGTKLDKNLHYYVFIESIEILFHVLIMLIPMPGYEVIFLFETNVDLKSYGIYCTSLEFTLIAQEMAGQGDQEGTDLLLQQFSPIENVSDKQLRTSNQKKNKIQFPVYNTNNS